MAKKPRKPKKAPGKIVRKGLVGPKRALETTKGR